MISDYLFCSTNSPKPEDSQFTIREDKEKQQILTSERLERANVDFSDYENS